MRQAFLGLGGNIGDTIGYLREAVLALETESPDGAVEVAAVSSVYETEPIGGPEQDVFLNIVAEIKTSLEPYELLELCLGLERATGRVRRVRWGPRTLDVDVLWVEGVAMNEANLTIPHPRMTLRRFVMVPLGEISPEFLAGWKDPEDGEIKKLGSLFPEGAEVLQRSMAVSEDEFWGETLPAELRFPELNAETEVATKKRREETRTEKCKS